MIADRLAPRELLGDLPADVELIDVAKLPRGRSAQQVEINRLVVEHALAVGVEAARPRAAATLARVHEAMRL